MHWPAVCRARDPDLYDIPPIEDAPKGSLNAMGVTYRLMGIDGEATEDRVESLQDGSESELDPAVILKRYGLTQALCRPFVSRTHPGS